MINSKDLNFSFSGLKTAVIYKIKKMKEDNLSQNEIRKNISFDFENAVAEILLKKIHDAISKTKAKSLLIGGGVIANNYLRKIFNNFASQESIDLYIPEKFLTGDNAFMIGLVAMSQILNNKKDINWRDIKAESNWNIEDV